MSYRDVDVAPRLEDRAQIQWAVDDYGYGMDRRDSEQWLRAFHADAVYDVDHPKRICQGHDDLLDWVQGVWTGFKVTNHFTPNEQVTFTGDDTATGLGRGAVMFVMADGTYVTGAAIFDDKFERRDGSWKIAYRKVDVNHLAQLRDALVTVDPGGTNPSPLDASTL